MSHTWNTQQILALAPDPASAKAGQGLVSPAKWVSLGRSEQAVWGECQGSGSTPYQVQIELTEPAFRCSCPSRKFPCKHGLGLFLMFANNSAAIKPADPPAWVAEWLAKRAEKAEKPKQAARPDSEKSPEEQAKAAEEQAKRAAQRQKRVAQGLQDLDLWLRDLVRQGFAAVQARPYKFWDDAAGRLVDAQAPGVARMLREMGSLPGSGAGWQERLLEKVGLLTLLLEAYGRLETLPEPTQADVREGIGWTVRQESVLAGTGVADCWRVLGRRSYEEELFRVHRTWLRGRTTDRDALLVNFVRQGQPMETLLAVGTCFDAEMAFFPSAWPLRALLKERTSTPRPLTDFPAYADAPAMLSAYADALACSPWLEAFPAPLADMIPVQQGGAWGVRDRQGHVLPLARGFDQGWSLLALSGGHPLRLFGEWEGANLLPVSVWTEAQGMMLL
jgi:hypothetical protein